MELLLDIARRCIKLGYLLSSKPEFWNHRTLGAHGIECVELFHCGRKSGGGLFYGQKQMKIKGVAGVWPTIVWLFGSRASISGFLV